MIIKIKYSKNLEIERILNTLKRIKWFEEMGYKVDLPKKINLKEENLLSRKYIKNILLKEYNKENYKKIGLTIQKRWAKISGILDNNLMKNGFRSECAYSIILTKYGTKGSYRMPDKIIISFTKRTQNDLLRTIIHEIIHLNIEKLILKYKITHWQKERIVDLTLSRIFPKFTRMQKMPINTKKVDKFFEKFYPDMEKVIKGIASK